MRTVGNRQEKDLRAQGKSKKQGLEEPDTDEGRGESKEVKRQGESKSVNGEIKVGKEKQESIQQEKRGDKEKQGQVEQTRGRDKTKKKQRQEEDINEDSSKQEQKLKRCKGLDKIKRWDRRHAEKSGRKKDKEKHRLHDETQIVEKRQNGKCKQQNKKGDQREEGKQQALQDV